MPHSSYFSCALITGASSGLGAEFARQLAPRCAKLVLLARREAPMIGLAEEIRAAHPHTEVFTRATDLTNTLDHERLMGWLAAEDLVPDMLVNNAGMGDYGEFQSAEWAKLEDMLRINIEALTRLSHSLVPGMIHRATGAIINVSSLASLLPIPDFAVYAATKAYVSSFSEALRIELKPHHIDVLAVCPGPVHTEFGAIARRRGEPGDGMPGKEYFYATKEQVVAESLQALDARQARVFPTMKIALAAALIGLLPMVAVRAIMSSRPRKS